MIMAGWAVVTSVGAQDDNEFQRIARRIMDAYEVGAEVEHAPDSAHWYGGAYLGASSKGRAMPSAYFSYIQNDKLLLTGNMSMDLSELTTQKNVETDFRSGASTRTNSDIFTHYEKEDASIRLDYSPRKRTILTVGFLESFNHRKVRTSTIKTGVNASGGEAEPQYEEQMRDNTDLKLGGLFQYLRDFAAGGRLTARANLKYHRKPTDVESDTWAAQSPASLRRERQTLYNFDPYFMLSFQSKDWNGFSFRLQERYTIEDMRINDTASRFNYNTYSWRTTLNAKYKCAWLALDATGHYENFRDRVDNHLSPQAATERTYNDWMLAATAEFRLSERHKLLWGYDRGIKRPSYTQRYPFAHIGGSIGEMVVGNTALGPSTDNQAKVVHTYKTSHWTLTSTLSYKRTDDDITMISSYDELSQRSVKTWINDAQYDILRYTGEGEVKYGLFSMVMRLHAQYLAYEGDNVNNDDAWSYSFKVRPQVKLPKGWTLATSAIYTGRETHRYYYNRTHLYLSLRAVKEIGDWAMYAFVQDILQQDRVQVLTNKDYNTTTTDDLNGRALTVGCSYTF